MEAQTQEHKESEIIQTLKEKLDMPLDEAKKVFQSIEDKLALNMSHEELLKIVTSYITKNPIKSLAIAFALGFILAKATNGSRT